MKMPSLENAIVLTPGRCYLLLLGTTERTLSKDNECHSILEGAEDKNNVFIVCAVAIFTRKRTQNLKTNGL